MPRPQPRIDPAMASDDVAVGAVVDDPHSDHADSAHFARRDRVVEPLERRVIELAFLDDDAIPGFVREYRVPFSHWLGSFVKSCPRGSAGREGGGDLVFRQSAA